MAAENVNPVSSSPEVEGQQPPTQSAGPQGVPPGGALSGTTQIKNLAQFKEMAPEVYERMMLGLAMKIVNEMKDHQERLKELWREGSERRR